MCKTADQEGEDESRSLRELTDLVFGVFARRCSPPSSYVKNGCHKSHDCERNGKGAERQKESQCPSLPIDRSTIKKVSRKKRKRNESAVENMHTSRSRSISDLMQ